MMKNLGFTGKDLMRSEVVQYMSEVADQVVILLIQVNFWGKRDC